MSEKGYQFIRLKRTDIKELPAADKYLASYFNGRHLAVAAKGREDGRLYAALVIVFSKEDAGEALLRYFYDDGVPRMDDGGTVFEALFAAAVRQLQKEGVRSIYTRLTGTLKELHEAYEALAEVNFIPVHLVGRVMTYVIGDFYDSPFYSRAMPRIAVEAGDIMVLPTEVEHTADDALIIRVPEKTDTLSEPLFREYLAKVLAYSTTGVAIDSEVNFEVMTQKARDRIRGLLGEAVEQFLQEYVYIIG